MFGANRHFFVLKRYLLGYNNKGVNMKTLKRAIIGLFMIISLVCLTACEDATQIKCASISEITTAGSKNFGVRINYQEDKRLEGKSTDVQIKFSRIGEYTFWEENSDKLTFTITQMDEWYSITNLIYKAKGKEGEEKFEDLKDVKTKYYLINFNGKSEVTFRVVAGQKEKNINETGEILVGSEPISTQFVLKIK